MTVQSAFNFFARALPKFVLATAACLLGGAAPEYNVKAGYLLRFAQYVEWPPQAFADKQSPVVFAVLGYDPFGEALDATLNLQSIDGRPVQVVRVDAPTDDLNAHVVFIARHERRDEARWLNALRDRPVLTVGESPESLAAGAIVRFVEDRGRIRFDVNVGSAQRARLKIQSPMLVSAHAVYGARTDGVPPETPQLGEAR